MTDVTDALTRELDITNADHIALWIEANTIPDEPMNQCASWLACRIVEAHEAAMRNAATPEQDGLVERLQSGATELRDFKSGPPNRLGIADKYDEAANHIESQAAQIAELRRERDEAAKLLRGSLKHIPIMAFALRRDIHAALTNRGPNG